VKSYIKAGQCNNYSILTVSIGQFENEAQITDLSEYQIARDEFHNIDNKLGITFNR
jgi:hypothetical protein